MEKYIEKVLMWGAIVALALFMFKETEYSKGHHKRPQIKKERMDCKDCCKGTKPMSSCTPGPAKDMDVKRPKKSKAAMIYLGAEN